MKFKRFIKMLGKGVKKNAASGLTVAGMIGVPVTGYFVAKETPAANKRLKDNADKSKAEKLGIIVGSYPKSISAGLLTMGSIYGANHFNKKEIATLTAICATQASKNATYEKKVRELFGDEKAAEIENAVIEDRLHQPETMDTAIYTGHGNILCYEPFCGHFFYASQAYILKAALELDKCAKNYSQDYIELNDWFCELRLPESDVGNDFGWPYNPDDVTIDVSFDHGLTPEGLPYLKIVYADRPSEINQ